MEIVISRVLSGWINSIDKLVLAKFITIGEFGSYTRAERFAKMPDANLRTSITTPVLTYLSRKKSNTKFGDYLLIIWVIFLLAGTPCFIFLSNGDMLFSLFMGEQWIEMGWMLQWLGLLGFARVLQGLTVIICIDQTKATQISRYVIGSLFFVLALPLMILLFNGRIYPFVVIISITSIIYWTCIIQHTLIKFFPNNKKAIMGNICLQLIIAMLSVLGANSVYYIINVYACSYALLFSIIVQILIVFILFILFKKNIAIRIYDMIIERRKLK